MVVFLERETVGGKETTRRAGGPAREEAVAPGAAPGLTSLLGARGHPAVGKRLHIGQALEQVLAGQRHGVAVGAMLQQPALAQLLDAGVQRVGRDAAHAVLQQSKGLRMAAWAASRTLSCSSRKV